MTILHGDMRFYNNIFVQRPVRAGIKAFEDFYKTFEDQWTDHNTVVGTKPYDGYMTWEEFEKQFEGYCGMGAPASDHYYIPLPVWTGGNVFFNGAQPCDKEKNYRISQQEVNIALKQEENSCRLVTNLAQAMPETDCGVISTHTLGMAFEPEEKFENPDGTPIVLLEDILGKRRGSRIIPGPFAQIEDAEAVL